jgi:hypothetical protein
VAKVPLTISIRQEDLRKLDTFAGERRLTRGDAVGVLLEEFEKQTVSKTLSNHSDDPDYIPHPPNRSRLDRAKEMLAAGEATLGIHPTEMFDSPGVILPHTPQIFKKRDPMDQSSEYDDEGVQAGPGTDFDQTRRRR